LVSAQVQSSVPIALLDSPSHKVQINRSGLTGAQILLDPQERRAATKDFVLEYMLSGGEVQSGLMLYEQDGQGWYLWTMEPPLEVLPEQLPSREFIFVLDVSGSMNGAPLDTAKRLMRSLAQVLQPTDYLNAITFSGGSQLLAERSLPATQSTVTQLLKFVDSARSGGGTELLPALEQAYGLPDVGAMRSIVIVTDGAIGTSYDAAGRINTELAQAGTFVFGVGDYLDLQTLNLLANAGQTQLLAVQNNKLDEAALTEFRAYVDRPLLRDVRLQFDAMQVDDQLPASVPILYAARPLTVVGRYQPPARGTLSISAQSAQGRFERSVNLDAVRPDPGAHAIRHVWAQRQVESLLARTDHPSQRETVTKLGLDYTMMTPWTSFVAVDQQVRNPGADSSSVQQPSAQRATTVDYASGDASALPGASFFGIKRHRGSQSLNAGQCQVIAGMAFTWQGMLWRSGVQGQAPVTEIRLRHGGKAWRQLTEYAPELKAFAQLNDRFELHFGAWRLLISDEGFDHYPSAMLLRMAAALAQALLHQQLPLACAVGGH
jgi:Ca-activated chloride channel family protein